MLSFSKHKTIESYHPHKVNLWCDAHSANVTASALHAITSNMAEHTLCTFPDNVICSSMCMCLTWCEWMCSNKSLGEKEKERENMLVLYVWKYVCVLMCVGTHALVLQWVCGAMPTLPWSCLSSECCPHPWPFQLHGNDCYPEVCELH